MGIYNGDGVRQNVLTFVVIGDHQIDPQLPAQISLRHGSNAAVHSDDQLDSLGVELVDGDGVQAVAFLQTAGDIADAVSAVAAQKVRQQAGGGDSVHIIVAEYRHLFSPGQGKAHPAGGKVHVRHQKRVQKRAAAVQIILSLGRGLHTPGGQYHGGQGGVACGGEGVDCVHFRF